MPSIFLSYRRADSPDTVKLLYERLKTRLPRWDIFYDHENIAPGEKFPERLRSEVTQATVVLVIVGPQWAELLRQRQHEPVDHVRSEVELALRSPDKVLPVLINRAVLPQTDDLGRLQPLLEHNTKPLRPDPDFEGDLEVLIDHLKQLGGSEAVGTILADRYTLTDKIGEGGMGVVFLAEQKKPVQRKVAVKLIKPGMDSREVLARFDAERQALAVMDHANVARVLDGGLTPSGRPFFVMEYVKGVPITQYCDDKKLTPKQRLELFIPVCNAVQHAHQKGIIHRDIKPSNVLVEVSDGKAVPKVIDFGLAKALGHKLTDMTLHTAFDTRVGTLEYSSPEQAAGRAFEVDTRSDIYSLGALLYELLTGAPPFTREELMKVGEDRMRQMIRETEPTKPSKKLSSSGELPGIAIKRSVEAARLSRLVKGDLDWIVMKCLEKEPARRYETSNQLGEELRRFLSEQPVQAGPPSARYRFKKFLRRNKGPVLAASLIVLALLAGIVGTGIGLVLAKQAADREKLAAEKLLEAADKEREHELDEVRRAEQKKRDEERTAITMASALKQALEMRRQYNFKHARAMLTQAQLGPTGNPALRQQVQTALEQLDFVEQLDRIRQDKALIVEGKRQPASASPKYVKLLMNHGLDILNGDETALGDAVIRSPLRDELLAALDDWLGEEPDSVSHKRLCKLTAKVTGHAWRGELAAKWDDETQLTRMLGEVAPEEMTVALLVGVCSRIKVLGGNSEIWLDRARIRAPGDFWVWFELGSANYHRGKEYAAMSAQAFHGCLAVRQDSVVAWNNLGIALTKSEDLTGAIAALNKATKLDPKYAVAFFNLGCAWSANKERDKAIRNYDEAIRLNPEYVSAFINRGNALYAKNEYDKAIQDFDAAIRLGPNDALAFYNRGRAWDAKKEHDKAILDFNTAIRLDPNDAAVFNSRGRTWKAKKDYDKAIQDFDAAIQLDPTDAGAFNNRGLAWVAKREYDEAINDFDASIRLNPRSAIPFFNRGNAWYDKKEYDKAIKDYDAAIRLNADYALAFNNRGNAWSAKQEPDKAIQDYNEAVRIDPKDADAFYNRGRAWHNKKEHNKAIQDYNAAILLKPDYIKAIENRGSAWFDLQEYDKALRDFDVAVRTAPNANRYNNRGRAWSAKQEYDKAIADYSEAILLDPKFVPAVLNRGINLHKKQDYDKAIQDFNAAVRLDPQYAVAFSMQITTLAAAKRHVGAIAAVRDAQQKVPKKAWPKVRYSAACAFALAGCGTGDAAKLTEKERKPLREQALAWLRDEMASYEKLAALPDAASREAAAAWFRLVKQDSDFDGVRDAKALAKLDEPERVQWQQFWQDVDAALKKAEKGP